MCYSICKIFAIICFNRRQPTSKEHDSVQWSLAIVDFLVTGKLSTTEGESTILKDIFWRRYAFKFYRLIYLPYHILSRHVAFCQCGIIHVYATYSYVGIPCHILSRQEAYFQCVPIHESHFE